jgi:hypothetical protein
MNHPRCLIRHIEAWALSVCYGAKPWHLPSFIVAEQRSEAFGEKFLKAGKHVGPINQLSHIMQKYYKA